MSLGLKIYEAFKDDEPKAKVLSEIIDDLDRRIIISEKLATRDDIEIVKLSLQKEIEQVRLSLQKEIEQVRLSLQKEIEQVKLSLQKEIEQVRLSLQKEIEQVRSSLVKWVIGLIVVQTGVLVSVIALLR